MRGIRREAKRQEQMIRRLTVLTMVCAGVALPDAPGAHRIENIFRPLSTPAREISDVSILAVIICAVIFTVVAGLLTYAIIRYRRRPGDNDAEPPQVYGSNQIEAAWTVIPIIDRVCADYGERPRDCLGAESRSLRQTHCMRRSSAISGGGNSAIPSLGITTANELHMPLSRLERSHEPTFLKLESADVAHSFWVPRLNGKTDVIPNRANEMWIDPHEAGDFIGNCAEYCGTQHANMLIRVIVQPKTRVRSMGSGAAASGRRQSRRSGGQASVSLVLMRQLPYGTRHLRGGRIRSRFNAPDEP